MGLQFSLREPSDASSRDHMEKALELLPDAAVSSIADPSCVPVPGSAPTSTAGLLHSVPLQIPKQAPPFSPTVTRLFSGNL